MDTNEKLDLILEKLEALEQNREEVLDELAVIQEAIANLSLPGSGYNTFDSDL